MQFPAKKNAVAQKHCTISRQENMAFSTPGRVVLGFSSPSPRVCTDGRTDGWTYADVTTKIFRIDRLPNLLSNGAPLAGFARRLRYKSVMKNVKHVTSWTNTLPPKGTMYKGEESQL